MLSDTPSPETIRLTGYSTLVRPSDIFLSKEDYKRFLRYNRNFITSKNIIKQKTESANFSLNTVSVQPYQNKFEEFRIIF